MTIGERIRAIFRPTKKKAAVGITAAVMAAALPVVERWEGLRTSPYEDVVGVLTVCYGETEGVEMRDYAPAECESMLQDRLLRDYYQPLVACIDGLPSAPVEVQAAFTSWAYNVGVGAACGSTLARYARAGEWEAACNELPKWRFAGGKVWQGLVNRRADERELCLGGLN
jgi:lysozyme